MQAHIDKINEMASVMKKAIEVDEGRICDDEERIKQLEVKADTHHPHLIPAVWNVFNSARWRVCFKLCSSVAFAYLF